MQTADILKGQKRARGGDENYATPEAGRDLLAEDHQGYNGGCYDFKIIQKRGVRRGGGLESQEQKDRGSDVQHYHCDGVWQLGLCQLGFRLFYLPRLADKGDDAHSKTCTNV